MFDSVRRPVSPPVLSRRARPDRKAVASTAAAPKVSRPLFETRIHKLKKKDAKAIALELPGAAGVPFQATRSKLTGFIEKRDLQMFGPANPRTRTSVDVTFGKLNRDQFAQLHRSYGGKSAATYDPERSYTLLDFMPPQLQALAGRHLVYGERKLKGVRPLPFHTSPDRDRTKQDMSLFFGDAFQMETVMTDPKAFQEVRTLSAAQLDPAGDAQGRNKGLQPGDVMMVYAPTSEGGYQLAHSTTYVDKDLFFDKPDTDSKWGVHPYRFGTYGDVMNAIRSETKNMDGTTRGFGEYKVVIRRARSLPPPPRSVFSLSGKLNGAETLKILKKHAGPAYEKYAKALYPSFEGMAGPSLNSMGLYGSAKLPMTINAKTGVAGIPAAHRR
jgi:hypothetical protein